MEFLWTTITVKNMEESLKFYEEIVGLPLNKKFGTAQEAEFAFLGEGETKIELIKYANKETVTIGPDISMGFRVASIEGKLAFLEEKGIPILSGPFSPNPSTKFFFILDPNGIKIQFVEMS
jgi:Lactoylglutathione lyase and related lyases